VESGGKEPVEERGQCTSRLPTRVVLIWPASEGRVGRRVTPRDRKLSGTESREVGNVKAAAHMGLGPEKGKKRKKTRRLVHRRMPTGGENREGKSEKLIGFPFKKKKGNSVSKVESREPSTQRGLTQRKESVETEPTQLGES